ncbi:MAG: peptidyl-prolyl cis-trans isomerase [Syntrophaceae bacterium]|nr:peptidyl-prolyl cis-trans isomerase [Syntrophaceae bacterium]
MGRKHLHSLGHHNTALITLCLFLFLLFVPVSSRAAEQPAPVVVIQTSMGNIEVELNAEKAPNTVKNFLQYVNDHFYDGTIFHRVMYGFMIQGGGFTKEMEQKKSREAIASEAGNGLKNERGTIAMARTDDPHSATSQFFINTRDNYRLNYYAPTTKGYGYTVFGKVTSGMDVVDKIEIVKTVSRGNFDDVPANPVMIEMISLKQVP